MFCETHTSSVVQRSTPSDTASYFTKAALQKFSFTAIQLIDALSPAFRRELTRRHRLFCETFVSSSGSLVAALLVVAVDMAAGRRAVAEPVVKNGAGHQVEAFR